MKRRIARTSINSLQKSSSSLPRQEVAEAPPLRSPFYGKHIDEYTSRYWCVKFTEVKRAHENREMQRLCQWYATRVKVVYLDYVPLFNMQLRQQIAQRMKLPYSTTTDLTRIPFPVLFINKKLVGDLRTMYTLEESGRLKDVLQFGMLWHMRPDANSDVHPQALPVPPSFYGDEAMFRGTYRGAPIAAPVVKLPKLLPKDSIVHGNEASDL